MTTTAQHTPGPWRIGDTGWAVFGPKTDQSAPATIVTSPPPTLRVSLDERKANIRLIAAAPELLAACEATLTWARTHGDHAWTFVKLSDAAIRKATA